MTKETATTHPTVKADKEPVIIIKDLQKSFGQETVLKNISLQLMDGENLVVLGKSGTGKSVLVKCIIGLLNADSGTIQVLGKNVPELNKKELGQLRGKNWFPVPEWCLIRFHDRQTKPGVSFAEDQERPHRKRN
jgi:ABC-type transport system involved in cytochrome bd biosynthesis fused ATPase/permease subunit